ncbi:kelch domain-containing protein 10-like [Centruroides sculpturatus]|uniref:kelch domain-containing protein 10-like n=1 Tax=Centruroides sculpturatus TaxID=218467 RepID=UPI000C6C96F5|nr:kelch domain-containing protein 10-like [Centruroides sculpturatus]
MDLDNKGFKFCPRKIIKVEYKGTNCPEARSGHRIVADNANVYSFGGYNPDVDNADENYENGLFKELWRFNIASKEWTNLRTKGQTPQLVASHSAILLHHYLLVFGGTGVPFGFKNGNTLQFYDIPNNCWKKVATSGSCPPKLYGQALALQDDLLYVVGGTSGLDYFLDVHFLNLKTKQWETLCAKEHPFGRYRHEIAIYKNKIYVFGGGTAIDSLELTQIPTFDLNTHKWELVQTTGNTRTPHDMPCERKCHGCVQFDKDVYVFGGFTGREILSDIWKMDLEIRQWTRYQYELPETLYFHSVAAAPNGQVFIFGGIRSMFHKMRTNDMYTLWINIPTLKEICWQAVLYYIPYLSKLPVEQLLSIGIPNTFISRLTLHC